MDEILKHYDSLKVAIDSEAYEDAGQFVTQLDLSLRQLFAASPQLSDSELQQLAEINEFLLHGCERVIETRTQVESELKSFSKGKKMKKAYGK